MSKLVSVVHISLDGFVAGPGGELTGFDEGEENLEFVCWLTKNADAMLMGRVSYELLNSYWPSAKDIPDASDATVDYSNWYNKTGKIVVSKTMSAGTIDDTIILRDIIPEEITAIKKQAGKNILVFGSPSVAHALQQLDLIDEYWVFINPVLFGEGIPLFRSPGNKTKLKLINTQQFPNGELAMNYTVSHNYSPQKHRPESI